MAVQIANSPNDVPDLAAEPLVDSSRTVSGTCSDGSPEINLGAFRGLAFALLFETVFVILGTLAWHIFLALR
jgi:hypothetical protein